MTRRRVDTPNTQVTLTRPGLYRIDVVPDRETTTLTVREGEALVALANGAQQTLPGQTVSVVGANPANADIRNSIGVDGFDTWSADRDRRYERGRSTAYVSREMVGYADLDEYGSWQTYPEYGPVWFPTAGGARLGALSRRLLDRRRRLGPHVGRSRAVGLRALPLRSLGLGRRSLGLVSGRLCRPSRLGAGAGRVGRRPGLGRVSIGHGNPVYGWVPLGWGDAYHPNWRRCSYNCWARYNRPYAVNVTVRPTAPPARYRNAGVPGALSAVAAPALVGRRPVATNLVNVPMSLATSAPMMTSAPPVARGPRRPPVAGERTPARRPAPRRMYGHRDRIGRIRAVSRPAMPATPGTAAAPDVPRAVRA